MKEKITSFVAYGLAGVTGVVSGLSEFVSALSINEVAVISSIFLTAITTAVNWIYKHRTLKELKKIKRLRGYPDLKDLNEKINGG